MKRKKRKKKKAYQCSRKGILDEINHKEKKKKKIKKRKEKNNHSDIRQNLFENIDEKFKSFLNLLKSVGLLSFLFFFFFQKLQ